MTRPVTLTLAAAGLLLGTAAVAAVAGERRWRGATARAVAQLDATAREGPLAPFDPGALDGLPAPLARYLHFAIRPGRGGARRMRVEHAGTFAARPGRWAPFTSVQHVAVDPPGFVWDAVIRMAPGLPVRVRDGYLAGEGAMAASVVGLVPMVDQHGTPELAAGSLMRYLAEAAWLPSALFSRGVVWTPVNDSTARATLTDSGVTVALDLHFGPRGEILRVSGDRYRDVAGRGVLTPWEGRFSDYALRDGFVIPLEGEVAWLLPEGRTPYWRGRVVGVTYDDPRDGPRTPHPPSP